MDLLGSSMRNSRVRRDPIRRMNLLGLLGGKGVERGLLFCGMHVDPLGGGSRCQDGSNRIVEDMGP